MTQPQPEAAIAATTAAPATPARPRYPIYRASGVEWLGEIPAHWQVMRLKHWSTFVTSGSRGWAEHYSDSGPLFIRIGDLSGDAIDISLTDAQHVTPPSNAEGHRTRILPSDVLISITANVGAIGLAPDNIPEAYVNQHVAIARTKQNCATPRWAAYCLTSDASRQQFNSLMYGGTKEGLSLDDVRSLVIPIPPLAEQRAIAAYLDRETARLDALVAAKRRLIGLLREKRAALISHAVTPTARDTDHQVVLEIVPSSGQGWRFLPLKRWVSSKITDGPHETPEFLDNGIPFISAEAIQGSQIDFGVAHYIAPELHASYCQKAKPMRGDILLCKAGATTGKLAMVEVDFGFSIWSPLALIKANASLMSSRFLFFALHAS